MKNIERKVFPKSSSCVESNWMERNLRYFVWFKQPIFFDGWNEARMQVSVSWVRMAETKFCMVCLKDQTNRLYFLNRVSDQCWVYKKYYKYKYTEVFLSRSTRKMWFLTTIWKITCPFWFTKLKISFNILLEEKSSGTQRISNEDGLYEILFVLNNAFRTLKQVIVPVVRL